MKAHVRRVAVVDTYRFGVVARSKKKTDRADAAALARFLKLGWLPEVPVPSERVRELRQLLQARETLVSMRTKLKNMAHAAFIAQMERLLWLYSLPLDPCFPVVCFDERPCFLIGERVEALTLKAGSPHRQHYEYARHGGCVAGNAPAAIISPSAHLSASGNHTHEEA